MSTRENIRLIARAPLTTSFLTLAYSYNFFTADTSKTKWVSGSFITTNKT